MEIEHTKVNGITATIIIVFSSIGLIILIAIIIMVIVYCIKKSKYRKNSIDDQETPPSYIPPSSTPQIDQPNQSKQINIGNDSTTFNNYTQQQNIFYEPSRRSIND